jgi:3-isopropylmalate/(R)-2-methylmalate dehydratase small subunit
MTPLRGRAWVYRGLLDVDWELCSWSLVRELRERGVEITYATMGRYCLAEVDPTFAERVRPGDFLVGEANMGYGHDHDHACISLRGAGVGAVLCDSSAPYFLRNCIDHGLPVVEVPGISSQVQTGDPLVVDLVAGTVTNTRTDQQLAFGAYPPFLLERLEEGGLYPWLLRRFGPRQDETRQDGPRKDGPRQDGPRKDGGSARP